MHLMKIAQNLLSRPAGLCATLFVTLKTRVDIELFGNFCFHPGQLKKIGDVIGLEFDSKSTSLSTRAVPFS